LAAGCATSISRIIVAASFVTNSRPRWLMISLLRPGVNTGCAHYLPYGPNEVRTISLSSPTAWMLRRTASSRPERCCRQRQMRGDSTVAPSRNSCRLSGGSPSCSCSGSRVSCGHCPRAGAYRGPRPVLACPSSRSSPSPSRVPTPPAEVPSPPGPRRAAHLVPRLLSAFYQDMVSCTHLEEVGPSGLWHLEGHC
jgi:hypothetical protein